MRRQHYLKSSYYPFRLLIACSVMFLMCSPGHASSMQSSISGELMVFHAGSLAVPFKEVAAAFEKEHPNVHVLLEAAGSRASARKISDLHRRADVFGSADYTVIDTLLIPDYARWNIRFAANEMVIAYTNASRRAADINSDNWQHILLEKNIAYGRSDPNADPCGYRTVLTSKLAENYYKEPGLANQLLEKDQRHIRPKETDLLALLEAGEIDYFFIYRSVARQHGLKWVTLPDEINLKNAGMTDLYKKATVEISGKTPGSVVQKPGAPMVYGVTIPKNAPNPAAAEAFVAFLLDHDKGMVIMEQNGQPSLVPTFSATFDEIPESLKRFARKL